MDKQTLSRPHPPSQETADFSPLRNAKINRVASADSAAEPAGRMNPAKPNAKAIGRSRVILRDHGFQPVGLHVSRVRKAFSGSAHRYDAHTEIQSLIAAQLLEKIPRGKILERILDVGMGTGRMTQKLTQEFPGACVVGIDFAEGMVAQARRRSHQYRTVQADALHVPFKSSQFDLVVSNLTYQWVGDLGRAFAQNYDALVPKGLFFATLFGRHSLYELFESLAHGGARDFFPQRLPALPDVEKALRANRLHVQEVHSQRMTFDFHGMWDLLVWIKTIGAVLPRRGFIGKRILMKANQYYYEHFKTPPGVAATFEVIWVEAKKI